MPPLPMVVLADHNSIMVPGVDSEAISKEISTVVQCLCGQMYSIYPSFLSSEPPQILAPFPM